MKALKVTHSLHWNSQWWIPNAWQSVNSKKSILDADDRPTAAEAMMENKMIIQEKREAEIANENEEDDDCSEHVTKHDIAKPSTSKVQEAFGTLVNFSMFAENNEIWDRSRYECFWNGRERVGCCFEAKNKRQFFCATTVKISCIFICYFVRKLPNFSARVWRFCFFPWKTW